MNKLFNELQEISAIKKEYRKEVEKLLVVMSIKVSKGMPYDKLQKELGLLNASLEMAAKAEKEYSELLKRAEPIFLS